MKETYTEHAELFKALSDGNRLMILEMLTEGELCACRILEKFKITQPTLSHHMKILCGCGLVNGRKMGKWTFYSINKTTGKTAVRLLKELTTVTKKSGIKKICGADNCDDDCL
ncbi:MAG: metalloregulator ArsR/SmtB family transcription factor [Treponema sp.]|nr:metalloregulator ArsR/SmtB family transcription factor [Treponema sp.]